MSPLLIQLADTIYLHVLVKKSVDPEQLALRRSKQDISRFSNWYESTEIFCPISDLFSGNDN